MSAIQNLLNTVLKLERENLMTYEVYVQVTTHMGMKKLLQGILQDVAEHVREMEKFNREAADFPDRFSEPSDEVFDKGRFDIPASFDALGEYTDCLHSIIDKESLVSDLYDLLSGLSRGENDKYYFRRLADDVKRHISWTQDRLDLEMMF